MAKLTLTDLTSIVGNETTAIAAVNANNALIEAAIENTLSRDGTATNTMEATLDMNSNTIINLPAPSGDTEPLRKGDIGTLLSNPASYFVQASAPSTGEADGSVWIDSDSTDLDLYTLSSGTWSDSGVNVKGAAGTDGTDGTDAAIPLTWNTATSGDPGTGGVRGNAAQGSITSIAFDDVDSNSANIEALIQQWDNSTGTPKATIYIFQGNDKSKFVILTLDSVFSDQTGYWTATVTVAVNGGTIDNGAAIQTLVVPNGNVGATGPAGPATVPTNTVRVLDTTGTDPSAGGYANGQTIDGVTIATGELILRATSGGNANDGVYVVPASGAASRDGDFDTFDEHPGKIIIIQEGTANADTIWFCTSNEGGTLDTTAIVFEEVQPDATATNKGLVELATDAEVTTGSDTERAVTPAGLHQKTASATAIGLVELATNAETITGTDTARAVTPANLAAKVASTTAAGIAEIATAAEINTGTDTGRTISPDSLAGSNFGTVVCQFLVFDDSEDTATGDGAGDLFFRIPSTMSGMDLVGVAAQVQTAGTTGTLDVQIHNVTDTADMLSTKITIDSGETDSSTAATPAVINTATDDVVTGDQLRIDVDAVHSGTAAKGLLVELQFRLP